jgi:GntR family transcriptional regulator
MYRQIAEDLRQKIESGELGHGDQLPTELELRERYDASRNTIRDAVKWLITRGLVETRPGQGTFVVEKMDPFVTTLSANPETGLGGGEGAGYVSEARAQRRKPRETSPRVEIQQAEGVASAELQLDEGSTVVSRHQRRYIDNKAWSLQTSFYPMSLAAKARRLLEVADIEEGTVRYLWQTLEIKQAGYRDTITVRAPNANEIAFFSLPSDGRIAVIEIVRTAFDENRLPFRVTVSVFPADRNKFVVNVGFVPSETTDEIARKKGESTLEIGRTQTVDKEPIEGQIRP